MSSLTERGASRAILVVAVFVSLASGARPQELGARWGTAERERAYYRIVQLPMPAGAVIEAGAFEGSEG